MGELVSVLTSAIFDRGGRVWVYNLTLRLLRNPRQSFVFIIFGYYVYVYRKMSESLKWFIKISSHYPEGDCWGCSALPYPRRPSPERYQRAAPRSGFPQELVGWAEMCACSLCCLFVLVGASCSTHPPLQKSALEKLCLSWTGLQCVHGTSWVQFNWCGWASG